MISQSNAIFSKVFWNAILGNVFFSNVDEFECFSVYVCNYNIFLFQNATIQRQEYLFALWPGIPRTKQKYQSGLWRLALPGTRLALPVPGLALSGPGLTLPGPGLALPGPGLALPGPGLALPGLMMSLGYRSALYPIK